jgi:CTP:phosphocholine cytidylyltransferase-like protein
MEYFLGSIITLLTMFVVSRYSNKVMSDHINNFVGVKYSQSRMFTLVQPFLPTNRELLKPSNTQALAFTLKSQKRVIIMDGMAYWIQDNSLYTAEVIDQDQVQKQNAKIVDTMSMDKVQLDKISFIVDKLTEGLPNESGDSRNP